MHLLLTFKKKASNKAIQQNSQWHKKYIYAMTLNQIQTQP